MLYEFIEINRDEIIRRATAAVMDDFPVALARQIETACKHVARVILALTWVTIAVRRAVVIPIAVVRGVACITPLIVAVAVVMLRGHGQGSYVVAFATPAKAKNPPISRTRFIARPSELLPYMVTSWIGGQVSAGRVRLHHVERRSPAAACARLSRRQADREVGFGQSETDERRGDAPHSGTDQRAGG